MDKSAATKLGEGSGVGRPPMPSPGTSAQEAATAKPDGESGKANLTGGSGSAAEQQAPHISSAAYTEGDRCRQCLRWFWDKDGRWHRWIPTRMLAVAEFAREVTCPRCVTLAVRELRKELSRGLSA